MMKQEANIYEIAKEAGVSIATVSRVMNHSSTVSEKNTQRVLAAVEKLNYVPNIAARSLSTSTSTSVGVVIPDINNPFFSQLLQGITLAADEMGLNIFLFGTKESSEREHKVLDSMREHRLRGVIITPVSAGMVKHFVAFIILKRSVFPLFSSTVRLTALPLTGWSLLTRRVLRWPSTN